MDFQRFDEFCNALGRLYDSTVELRKSTQQLRASDVKILSSVRDLRDGTGRLLSAVEKHQAIVEAHERRQGRTEITVEAILEDLRRHRESRPPH